MRYKRYFLNALLACLLPACGTLRSGRTVAATAEVPRQPPSAEELEVGHIAFVRGDGKVPFVLINLDRGITLPDGAGLQTASMNQSVAHLKTTAERREGYQVADITSGRPRPGDRVILRYPKGDEVDIDDSELDDLPPLPTRPGQQTTAAEAPATEAFAAEAPAAEETSPASPSLPPLDSPVLESPPASPPFTPGPPAIRDDVEPRPPSREPAPLELPTLEPDDGSDYIQTLEEDL